MIKSMATVVEAYGMVAKTENRLRENMIKLISPFAPKALIRCHEGDNPIYRRAQLLIMLVPKYLKDVRAI